MDIEGLNETNEFVLSAKEIGRIVSGLVETVPEKYLIGLKSITIMRKKCSNKIIRQGGDRFKESSGLGEYVRGHNSQGAVIVLYMENILQNISRSDMRIFPFLADLVVGETLYHEIGHHILKLQPRYGDAERTADQWARKFLSEHFRKKHKIAYYMIAMLKFIKKKKGEQGQV